MNPALADGAAALDLAALRARLVAPAGRYAAVNVVPVTGSTNADLVTAARAGAEDRTVLLAERQTAGQGRRARGWTSPAGSGLYLSVLLRPVDVPANQLGWVTLLAGVALVRMASWAGVRAVLKWPNDLLIGDPPGKAAGVLAEIDSEPRALVLGIGLNVLPLPAGVPLGAGGLPATALADQGADTLDRTGLAVRLLADLADLEDRWRQAGGDPYASGLYEEYRACCATFGQRVRVELPGPSELVGTAERLESDGTLVIRADDGAEHPVHAGDVVHLRQVG